MIHRIVQFALNQRFLVLMLTALIVVVGAVSFQPHARGRLPGPLAAHG